MNYDNQRIGLYGGSFDPIHNGHVQAMVETAKRFQLDKIIAVPAMQNPLKEAIEGSTPEQRVDMVKLAIEGYEDFIDIDVQEIERGGKSYTIDTVKNYAKTVPGESLFLIVGMDTFDHFDEWKEVEGILQTCNLIVTSRPGARLPRSIDDLPRALHQYIALFDPQFIELNSGKNIQFHSITDVTISSTELRKRLRSQRGVSAYLPMKVEQYLRERNIYEPIGDRLGDTQNFLNFVAVELEKRRAIGVKAFDLTQINAPTDFTLIGSGTSTRHAKSIGEYIYKAVKQEFGVMPISFEGTIEGRWVLLDYGVVVIHIFYDFVRGEYNMEQLWSQGIEITADIIKIENRDS